MRTLTDENADRNDDDHIGSRENRPGENRQKNESRWEPPNSSIGTHKARRKEPREIVEHRTSLPQRSPVRANEKTGQRQQPGNQGIMVAHADHSSGPQKIAARKLLEAPEPMQAQD